MRLDLLTILCVIYTLTVSAASDQLQIGVKYKPDKCPLKTRKGDKLSMQWVHESIGVY